MKRLLDVLIVLALAGAVVFYISNRPSNTGRALGPVDMTGTSIPLIAVVDSSGIDRMVSTAGKLVYLFRTTCRFCEQTRPVWEHIAQEAGIPALAITPERVVPRGYMDSGLVDVVRASESDRTSEGFSFAAVPSTLVISAEGIVIGQWTGTLGPERVDSVLSASRVIAKH